MCVTVPNGMNGTGYKGEEALHKQKRGGAVYLKPIKIPFHVRQFECLLHRLDPAGTSRPKVELQLSKYLAGFKGEKSIEYPLSFLHLDDYLIFHNFRLSDGMHHFQIDFLILSPYFSLILEVKNIKGKVTINDYQMIRHIGQIEEAFQNPVNQTARIRDQLSSWLVLRGYAGIPIQTLVVFNSTKSILKLELSDQHNHICTSDFLPIHISSLRKQFTRSVISQSTLQDISNKLLNGHQELEFDILKYTGVRPEEVLRGVRCPKCAQQAMIRNYAIWTCPACGFQSRTAHLAAIQEYRHIFGRSINNRKLRDFLQIRSDSIAKKMLLSYKFPYSGESKRRIYYLTDKILEQFEKEI